MNFLPGLHKFSGTATGLGGSQMIENDSLIGHKCDLGIYLFFLEMLTTHLLTHIFQHTFFD